MDQIHINQTSGPGHRVTQRLHPRVYALLIGLAASPAPVSVFTPGRNLCHTVALADVRSAGGQRYRAGIFAAGTCTWERADLAAGVTLTTHPRTAGIALMRQVLDQPGFHARRISVPGAREAVLARVAPYSADLFAAYAGGVVQVNMTAPRRPAEARIVAVMRLVAPKR